MDRYTSQTSIKYAFVVFRHMDGSRDAVRLLSVRWIYRFFVGTVCCKCCCGRRQKELKKKMFKGKWLDVRKASDPDEIKWENLGYSWISIKIRMLLSWTSALILIFLALYALIAMTNWSEDIKEEIQTNINCPEKVTKR